MKITLRKKKLTTGRYSLYIEYYKGSSQNDQGKTEHARQFEYLKEYLNEDGHFAVLNNGKLIPVARNRVSSFVKTLKTL